MRPSRQSLSRVTIVGSGFASLFFLIYLLEDPPFLPIPAPLRRMRAPIDVTLVGPPEFVYFPALPEFLIGARTRQDVVVDIRPFLRRRHVHFIEDRIVGIEDAGRTILTASGARHGNDALFLGTGPTFRKDATPGTREFTCSPCYGPEDMRRFVAHIDGLAEGVIYIGFAFGKEDGFVAGRTGPMYECACLLDFALRRRGVRERFEIHFFSPNRAVGEKGTLTDRLVERGIIMDDGYAPAAFVAGGMTDVDGHFRRADAILYSPPMTGPAYADTAGLARTPGGHIAVDRYGQVPGLARVLAAGDCAGHEAPPSWVPHQAHMAQLRAQAAAANLRALLAGAPPSHRYRYELSCILDMGDDALWMHRSEDGRPPFRDLFPRRSRRLIRVKSTFERAFLLYLRRF
jgi:sulfide:quinone oxidoreductase